MPGVREPATRAAASLQTPLRPDHSHAGCLRLDKELETSVGRKERIVGALRQHVKDHKCDGTAAA